VLLAQQEQLAPKDQLELMEQQEQLVLKAQLD
jgi:hypothetical protein